MASKRFGDFGKLCSRVKSHIARIELKETTMKIVSKIAMAASVVTLALAPVVAEAEEGSSAGTSNTVVEGGSDATKGLLIVGGGLAFGTGFYFLVRNTKSN